MTPSSFHLLHCLKCKRLWYSYFVVASSHMHFIQFWDVFSSLILKLYVLKKITVSASSKNKVWRTEAMDYQMEAVNWHFSLSQYCKINEFPRLLILFSYLLLLDVLYQSPAGSILSVLVHSLLIMPPDIIKPLLPSFLALLPSIEKLNQVLPAAALLEEQELEWPVKGKKKSWSLYQW